jgi:hypothetical protein
MPFLALFAGALALTMVMVASQECFDAAVLKSRPMGQKKRKKLRGTVEMVIKPVVPNQPEKAQLEFTEQTNYIERFASTMLWLTNMAQKLG